jgi:hypothetical protein
MSSQLPPADAPPFAAILHAGYQALSLALEHQEAIEPRVPSGTVAGLEEDLHTLREVIPDAVVTAALYVQAIREVVRNAYVPKNVWSAYGVGRRLDPRQVKSVTEAADRVIDRLMDHPEEATVLCIAPEDLDALKAAREAVAEANGGEARRRPTRDQKRAAARVMLAISRIAAAGVLAYVKNDEERAPFEALWMTPGKVRAPRTTVKRPPSRRSSPQRAAI